MKRFLTLTFYLACSWHGMAGTIHNAAAGWSLQNGNPNGHWTYGTYNNEDVTDPTSFVAFGEGVVEPNLGLDVWWPADSRDPNVTLNNTSKVIELDGFHWEPRRVVLGTVGPSVIRFTVPQSGFYNIDITFLNNQGPFSEGTKPVAVNWNSHPLFMEPLALRKPVESVEFFMHLYLELGDTIDAVVGGAGGYTALEFELVMMESSHSVSELRDPAVEWNVGNGNPNGDWSYGRYDGNDISNVSAFIPFEEVTVAGLSGVSMWHLPGQLNPNVSLNATRSSVEINSPAFDPIGDNRNSIGNLSGVCGFLLWAPNALKLSPSLGGAAVRFTVPESGVYHCSATFEGSQEILNPPVSVAINHNSNNLFMEQINARRFNVPTNRTRSFSGMLHMNKGDTLDAVALSRHGFTTLGGEALHTWLGWGMTALRFQIRPLGRPRPFVITAVSRDMDADTINLTFNSRSNTTYDLFGSTDLAKWFILLDNIKSLGRSTTVGYPLSHPDTLSVHYLRIHESQ